MRWWLVRPVETVAGGGCPRCLGEIAAELGALPGVHSVERSRQGVRVAYDPAVVSSGELEDRARQLVEGLVHRSYAVDGMDCRDCAASIEATVARLTGVAFASCDFPAGRLILEVEPEALEEGSVEAAVRRLGYRIREAGQAPPRERLLDLARPQVRAVLGSGVLLAAGAVLSGLGEAGGSRIALAGAALLGAWVPLRRALGALRARRVDMNCLMLLAAAGATALGELAEAATVIFLFAVGEMLEGFAARRSSRAVEQLMEALPETARALRDGREVVLAAREVQPGEVVRVRPGEKVPLDGVVRRGTSSVDASALTGESLPLERGPGDPVFAGSLNQEGILEVEVQRPYGETTLSRVVRLVEEAHTLRRGARERFVDRFAAGYTPTVVAGAVLLAAAGPVLFGGAVSEWVYRSLVLLVIACPCALVISTPVSVVSAITGAARRGVLVKGGLCLERLAGVGTVALDKTRTLTRGRLRVVEVVPLEGEDPRRVLAWAAAVEAGSEHPVAEAVVRRARQEGVAFSLAEDFRAEPGRGARGRVEGREVFVGRPEALEEVPAAVEALRARGHVVVAVAVEGRPMGWIACSDTSRPEAAEAMAGLQRLGMRLLMLTGDHRSAAEAVASALGIQDLRAELLPEEKMAVLRECQERGEAVAMVGDGVNDAPALATATVGIAMGAAGHSVALETADVALLGDDLRGLPLVFALARRTHRVITQNIALSLVTKAVFLGLAVVGLAGMWMAILADMGASLLVTANGLRLAAVPELPPLAASPSRCGASCCGRDDG